MRFATVNGGLRARRSQIREKFSEADRKKKK
jgi:hypothetical protein